MCILPEITWIFQIVMGAQDMAFEPITIKTLDAPVVAVW